MQVTVHLNGHYTHEPLPPDIKPTPDDIASGKVLARKDGGWAAKVHRDNVTTRSQPIGEHEIIKHMIAVAMPAHPVRALARGTFISRREAVEQYVRRLQVDHYEIPDLAGFEVHDDGPDEKLFRELVAPFVGMVCGRTNRVPITMENLEAFVAKYMEPADAAAHSDHLHKEFGVTPKAKVTP